MTRYEVRDATLDDLDRIIQFEIDIAVISFADKAITDTGVHGKRVSAGVKSADDLTMVVVAEHTGLNRIFSLDKDFRVYLIHDRDPFDVVP